MSDDKAIVAVVDDTKPAEQVPYEDPHAPQVGRWYWVNGKSERWLGCVVHMGSNYVRLKGVRWARRVHQDEFFDLCTFEPDPDMVIMGYVGTHQRRTYELMEKVRQVTAQLGVGVNPALTTGSETQALTLRRDEPMDAYKTALVKAKDETLPSLFEEIKGEHAALARWMKARLIPLKAQAGSLKPAIKSVEDRIFSVQLYAGLTEEIVQIADGEPAPLTTKIHLFQRRAYMDEECLAAYETGGMEFKDIRAFDKWMAKARNRDRLLPFPRCILAFQVRRHRKERHASTWGEYIRFMQLEQMDKYTYLYMRNGQRMYRLATEIRFENPLFPDVDEREMLTGKLWAKVEVFDSDDEEGPRRYNRDDEDDDWDDVTGKKVQILIPDRQYQGLIEDDARAHKEWRDVKLPEAKQLIAENKKKPKGERDPFLDLPREPQSRAPGYALFDRDNVFYDDIANYIQKQIAAHNRLVLVLQGILDRSPVMHPHPPWVLWNAASFVQALELVYDLGKALVSGDAPDFDAYRARRNAGIVEGTIVLGQERVWKRANRDEDESGEMVASYRRPHHERRRYRNIDDNGPGKFAHVARIKRSGACVFEWIRTQTFYRDGDEHKRHFATRISVKRDALFNVEAYKPGDFKQFFDDPRTRENYLKWAPLLLEAEEYHAGNRKVREREEMPAPKPRTPGGSWEYRERKRKLALVGQAFELHRECRMNDKKTVYKKGSLWRVGYCDRGKFSVAGIKKDGTEDVPYRAISNLEEHDCDWRPDIPAAPKKSK
jgi:hypothetical protein